MARDLSETFGLSLTVVPLDQPIDYDTIGYADFRDTVKSVVPQEEADSIQNIECPCGHCSYEFFDIEGFFRH
eukprot:8532925-Karenia_brevis.AAC.1